MLSGTTADGRAWSAALPDGCGTLTPKAVDPIAAFAQTVAAHRSADCLSTKEVEPFTPGKTSSQQTWESEVDVAQGQVQEGRPLSDAQVKSLCELEVSAAADASSASPKRRGVDVVAVAAASRLLAANDNRTLAQIQKDIETLVQQGGDQSGAALQATWQQLGTEWATLQARTARNFGDDASVEAVLRSGLSAAQASAYPGAIVAGPDSDLVKLPEASEAAASAALGTAQSAASQGYGTLSERLVKALAAAYGEKVPEAVQDQILSDLKTKSYDEVAKAVMKAYRAQPGVANEQAAALTQLVAPVVSQKLYGQDPTPELLEVAKQTWLEGGSDADVEKAVTAAIAAQTWLPNQTPVRLAPASSSPEQSYQYYLKLLSNVVDLRKLGDKPVVLALRGVSIDGSTHVSVDNNAFDDTLVILSPQTRTAQQFAGSTHPGQLSTSTAYEQLGRVGEVSNGIYDARWNGPHQGDNSWRVEPFGGDGSSDIIPTGYDSNFDGQVSPAEMSQASVDGRDQQGQPSRGGDTSFGTLLHTGNSEGTSSYTEQPLQGPAVTETFNAGVSSVACLNYQPQDSAAFAPFAGQDLLLAVVTAA